MKMCWRMYRLKNFSLVYAAGSNYSSRHGSFYQKLSDPQIVVQKEEVLAIL